MSVDYKLYFQYKLEEDFFYPAAQIIDADKSFEWKSSSIDKPDNRRCFKINIKNKNSQGLFAISQKYFCIFGSADGS